MALLHAGRHVVDVRETGTGTAVILLHSTACDHRQWRLLMSGHRDRFRFLAVNRFGHGETSPWAEDRPQTMRDQGDLAVAAAATVDGPVHVVGHSLGGAAAIHGALALGEKLGRLVLLEPNPFQLLISQGRAEAHGELLDLRREMVACRASGAWAPYAERFITYWNGPDAWNAMPEKARATVLACMPANAHEWDAILNDDLAPGALAPIAGKTLLVHAADSTPAIAEVADILCDFCPAITRHVLDEGGHMAPLTRPDVVNPLIVEFLETGRISRPNGVRAR